MHRVFAFYLGLCLAPVVAFAHASKEGTTPIDGTTVSAVPVIGIDFDTPILITTMTVIGPDGPVDFTRETDKVAKTLFRVSPDAPLSEGAYQVEWRGLAEDGHVMQGGFAFTVDTD